MDELMSGAVIITMLFLILGINGNNLYGREYLAAVEMVKIHFNVNTEDNENEKE